MNNRLISVAFFLMHAAIAVVAQTGAEKIIAPLPSSVDNRTTPYFPSIISQVGESCASANGVGYIFTYEINTARGVSAADSANQYPYFGAYNFLNDGSEKKGTFTMFIDAWMMIRDNGIHNALDFGSIEPRSTKWVTGYEKYYRAMHNRVASIDSLSFLDPGTLIIMKRWLYDHGNGSPSGGIFTITASAYGVQDMKISSGPEKGKWIVYKFGTSMSTGPHALAVVGYNDSIRHDFNQDGKITNTIDLNEDSKIDLADQEHGAFILANTWGESSGDNGFFYAPYRLFVAPFAEGGSISNRAYFITVRKEYRPIRTFKVALTHNQRSSIALSVGIADDTSATVPARTRALQQFTYAGGNLPMCGDNESSAIELGLDVTDLLDSIPGASTPVYFLIIDAKDRNGKCSALSLIDYSGSTPDERPSSETPLQLAAGRNLIRVIAPSTRIMKEKRIIDPSFRLLIRHSGKDLGLHLPAGDMNLQLFRCDGRCVISSSVTGQGSWYTLPMKLQPGSYFIRITDHLGRRTHGSAAVIY